MGYLAVQAEEPEGTRLMIFHANTINAPEAVGLQA
jgi:hypothetical protein